MESKEAKCSCCHSHESAINPAKRLAFSIIFVILALFILKPFLFSQVFKRGCAYVVYPLYDDAIRQYKKAVFLNKQSDDAWDWLGYSYKGKGDIKKAIETYKDAIKINPNNEKARFGLGMIYAMNKNFNEAAGHFKYIAAMGKENEAALDLISYHRSSCEMLITCFEHLGKTTELKRAIDMTLKFYPDNRKAKAALLKIKGI
ncbi:MAG: tetratricopeptide repeat protein [Candidatus Omnitrophica bacterium]|nr:tetratricopeptide repeat protein [Candidatus Omnitrophota bacterium]